MFAALLLAVQGGPYDVGALSNEQHMVFFRSGATAFSWGHQYIAGVVETPTGSVLQLTTAKVPGAPWSLRDGAKNRSAGARFIEAVAGVLASAAALTPDPVESYALLEDGTVVPWTTGDYPGA